MTEDSRPLETKGSRRVMRRESVVAITFLVGILWIGLQAIGVAWAAHSWESPLRIGPLLGTVCMITVAVWLVGAALSFLMSERI